MLSGVRRYWRALEDKCYLTARTGGYGDRYMKKKWEVCRKIEHQLLSLLHIAAEEEDKMQQRKLQGENMSQDREGKKREWKLLGH